MPYICKIDKTPDYLFVEVTEKWEPGEEEKNACEVWTRVADACREMKMTRILSVWDVTGRLPTMAAYSLTNSPESFGWDRTFILALVHLQEERYNDSLFAETVAVNRGYRLKIFKDEQSATKWLAES